MAQQDYYGLLGVDRHAPEREIKRAYYRLARELHPDKAKSPEEARANAERLAVISKAYNTLKDPTKRGEYDGANKSAGTSVPAQASAPAAKPAAPAAGPGSGPVPAAGPPRSGPSSGRAVMTTKSADVNVRLNDADLASQRVVTAQKAFVKGMDFYKAQDFRKALPFFEAAVQNDPESEPHYHMKLAICLMRSKGSFTRAVEAAERACSMDAYNVEFKLQLGEIYEMAGVKSKARAVYEEVLKWEPENEKARFRLKMIGDQLEKENPNLLAKIFPSLFGKK